MATTTRRVSTKRVLLQAALANLSDVIVSGYDRNGDFYVASTTSDPDVNKALLDGGLEAASPSRDDA